MDLNDIRDLPVSTGGLFPFEPPDLSGQPDGAAGGGSGPAYAPWIALGVAGFLAAVAGSAALGWRRSVDGLPYQQQLWEKTVRLASWAGHPPQPGQTPASFAGALARRFRSLRDVDLLAQAYGRSRFGRSDALEVEERQRLARAWAKLRGDARLAGRPAAVAPAMSSAFYLVETKLGWIGLVLSPRGLRATTLPRARRDDALREVVELGAASPPRTRRPATSRDG